MNSIENRTNGRYYTGDMETGKAEAMRYQDGFTERQNDLGVWVVELTQGGHVTDFGASVSPDDAWRYALGAALGGEDE